MIFDAGESGQTAVLIECPSGRFGVEAGDAVEQPVVCERVFSNDRIVTSASEAPDLFQVDVLADWRRA